MGANYTICVGTVGGGLSYSRDGGETWNRIRDNVPSEGNIRTMTVYPDDAHRLLAGTDNGIVRSEDNGATWDKLDAPFEDLQIWSVTVDPEDTDTIFVGTRPGGFRSRDGGKTWQEMNMGVNLNCPIGTPRTTNILVDPRDHQTVWAGIEVDGVYKSLDGGDSWLHMSELGPDPFHGDVHGMAIRPGPTSAVYATSPFGLATSTDEGESWVYHEYPKYNESDARSYCRGVTIKADNPDVMFVGHGNAIPGDQGAIQQTRDGGKTWIQTDLPVTPNSVVYWFGTHKAVPDSIVAGSLYGYVYLSDDGGVNWRKLKKEFGEIRTVTLTPN